MRRNQSDDFCFQKINLLIQVSPFKIIKNAEFADPPSSIFQDFIFYRQIVVTRKYRFSFSSS